MTLEINRKFLILALSSALAVAVGCSSDDSENLANGDVEPTVDNATDYPATGVSDTCGGKCDNPDAALQSSSNRLLAALDMTNYENEMGETESFRLVGEVIEDQYFVVEQGQTLTVELYAADGASVQDFKVTAELTYEEEGVGAFVSDTIDTSELIPWQLLRIDVTGAHTFVETNEDAEEGEPVEVVEEREIMQTFEYTPGLETGAEVLPEPEDPFAPALDIHAGAIFIDPEVEAPSYDYPSVDGPFGLGGTEFWQRWPGGLSPTFSYSAGTALGRKCMSASAMRFEAIMSDPPESMLQLVEETNWSGRFFNWNDDYSDPEATGGPRGAVLWAWRTGLIKWISQTGADGTCYLPTYDMVDRAAQNCLARGASDDGEIEGCQGW